MQDSRNREKEIAHVLDAGPGLGETGMLSHENYTKTHISDLWIKTGADPSILERTIFAFGLLEAIPKEVEVFQFIFKGGTSCFFCSMSLGG